MIISSSLKRYMQAAVRPSATLISAGKATQWCASNLHFCAEDIVCPKVIAAYTD